MFNRILTMLFERILPIICVGYGFIVCLVQIIMLLSQNPIFN